MEQISKEHAPIGVAVAGLGLVEVTDFGFAKTGTHVEEHRDYFKGQVFTAYGYQIFESGAIRHGKFKHFRTDKSAGDCDFSQVPNLYHRKPRR